MNGRRLLYFIVNVSTIVKANVKEVNQPVLARGLSSSMANYLRHPDFTVPVGKKEESMKQNAKRALERAITNTFSRVHEDDDCCSEEENPSSTSPSISTNSPSIITSPSPSVTPSHTPTASPSYSEKKFLASDGEVGDKFGNSCSMVDDLVVVGAPFDDDYEGAAYLFKLDGTEVIKLDAGDDLDDDDYFGHSVSIDEKVVVGTEDENYVRVFSRDGTYERTLTCDDCQNFGKAVATHGNKIVTKENRGFFIYTTEGEILKEEDFGDILYIILQDVAISDEVVVWTASSSNGKTVVYSNEEPDFPIIAEIEQLGSSVEVLGDKLVIGNRFDNSAWLYNINGTLVKELEHDATTYPYFGMSVAITNNDKILVGAPGDDVGGDNTGSVFIYSAITGIFEEKVLSSDAQEDAEFGSSVCSYGSYYMVGAPSDEGVDTGEAYLFNLPS